MPDIYMKKMRALPTRRSTAAGGHCELSSLPLAQLHLGVGIVGSFFRACNSLLLAGVLEPRFQPRLGILLLHLLLRLLLGLDPLGR